MVNIIIITERYLLIPIYETNGIIVHWRLSKNIRVMCGINQSRVTGNGCRIGSSHIFEILGYRISINRRRAKLHVRGTH